MKIFGREPAAIVGMIQAVLALLVSFGLLDFVGIDTDADLAVVIGVVGALSALYLAYATSETLLAPVVEVIKAGLALGAIYGLNISDEKTGLLIAAVTAIFAAWQRGQVVPLDNPTFATVDPVTVVVHDSTGALVQESSEDPRWRSGLDPVRKKG